MVSCKVKKAAKYISRFFRSIKNIRSVLVFDVNQIPYTMSTF